MVLLGGDWYADMLPACERALRDLGCDVRFVATREAGWWSDAKKIGKRISHLPWIGPRLEWRMARAQRVRRGQEITENLRGLQSAGWRPDLLLYVLGWGEIVSKEMLDAAGSGAIKVGWLLDDPFLHDGSLVPALSAFDRLWVVDEAWADNIRLVSGLPTRLLTCGVDLSVHKPLPPADIPQDRRSEVVFVGASYQGLAAGTLRQTLLSSIADLGLRIYGDDGWLRSGNPGLMNSYQGRTLSATEANVAYNAARIVLNIHHPQFHMGTSLRTFAISASGAFQLADDRPGLSQFLKPGVEVETFASPQILRSKVLHYLKHDVDRQAIAKAGYDRVVSEHSYHHRLAILLSEAGCSVSAVDDRRPETP